MNEDLDALQKEIDKKKARARNNGARTGKCNSKFSETTRKYGAFGSKR